jgi:hypothetical protein
MQERYTFLFLVVSATCLALFNSIPLRWKKIKRLFTSAENTKDINNHPAVP